MRKLILFAFIGALFINAQQSQARPVSYPGGVTSMIMNNGDMNSLHLHYSPTVQYSVGYKFEHWRDDDFNIHAMQMNNLLKRWNNPESQAKYLPQVRRGSGT